MQGLREPEEIPSIRKYSHATIRILDYLNSLLNESTTTKEKDVFHLLYSIFERNKHM